MRPPKRRNTTVVTQINVRPNVKERKPTNSHNHQKPSAEAPQVNHSGAAAVKVIGVGASSADPVRYGRDDVRSDDEERVVVVPQRAAEDNEEEADGEDKGEGDYRF